MNIRENNKKLAAIGLDKFDERFLLGKVSTITKKYAPKKNKVEKDPEFLPGDKRPREDEDSESEADDDFEVLKKPKKVPKSKPVSSKPKADPKPNPVVAKPKTEPKSKPLKKKPEVSEDAFLQSPPWPVEARKTTFPMLPKGSTHKLVDKTKEFLDLDELGEGVRRAMTRMTDASGREVIVAQAFRKQGNDSLHHPKLRDRGERLRLISYADFPLSLRDFFEEPIDALVQGNTPKYDIVTQEIMYTRVSRQRGGKPAMKNGSLDPASVEHPFLGWNAFAKGNIRIGTFYESKMAALMKVAAELDPRLRISYPITYGWIVNVITKQGEAEAWMREFKDDRDEFLQELQRTSANASGNRGRPKKEDGAQVVHDNEWRRVGYEHPPLTYSTERANPVQPMPQYEAQEDVDRIQTEMFYTPEGVALPLPAVGLGASDDYDDYDDLLDMVADDRM